MALPAGIGSHRWDVEVSPEEIGKAMDWYENLQA